MLCLFSHLNIKLWSFFQRCVAPLSKAFLSARISVSKSSVLLKGLLGHM